MRKTICCNADLLWLPCTGCDQHDEPGEFPTCAGCGADVPFDTGEKKMTKLDAAIEILLIGRLAQTLLKKAADAMQFAIDHPSKENFHDALEATSAAEMAMREYTTKLNEYGDNR